MQLLLNELIKINKFKKNNELLNTKVNEIKDFLIRIIENLLLVANHRKLASNTYFSNKNNIKGLNILPSDVILTLNIMNVGNFIENYNEYLLKVNLKKFNISKSKFSSILNEIKANFIDYEYKYLFTQESENILNFNIQLIIEN